MRLRCLACGAELEIHLGVDAGGHELRSGDDDRVALLGVDEVVELGLADGIIAETTSKTC